MASRSPASIRFELTHPGGADLVANEVGTTSAVYHDLFEVGVPRTFLIDTITMDTQVRLMTLPDARALIRFATDATGTAIGVEPVSGHVLNVRSHKEQTDPDLYLVNTSLALFNRTVKLLTDAYPYERTDDDGDTYPGDLELRHLIESVDPAALYTPSDGSRSYWWTFFLADVAINLYDVDQYLDPAE